MSRYIDERCNAHIHRHHGVPPFGQVDQSECELGVEQCRERDDDRTRRDGRPGRQCACGVLVFAADPEGRVEHPVELAPADVGA